MSEKIVQLNEEVIKGQLKELVRGSVEETLNELLEAEAEKLTQAARYERNEQRQGYRSGHYNRNLTTTSGDVTLKMPKLKGISFETAIIERYRRRESSVEEALIEMYLAGVSVRRVEDITETLWGSKVSPSTISELNKKAYVHIEDWRNRPLQGGRYPYVYVDGIYLRRNWGGEFENVAILVAIAVNEDGYREVLGAAEGMKEDKASWINFFQWLRGRGLDGVKLIVGDKCLGMLEAVGEVFPEAKYQRCPAKQAERQGLFSGLLYCADCGSKLHFATGKNMTPQQDCYRCSRYKSNTGDCTMHFIREETLKLFVLQRIFDVTALFFDDAMAFGEAAKKQRFQEAEKEAKKRRREIAQAEKRIGELDRIFKRIYEDDISGTISHERFLKLSADYEAEQKELTEQVKAWRDAVETFEQDQADFASFAAIVRKYVGIRELTPTIVNEFVKKIIVHAPDKSSGHRRQKIELVWNFIGEVNLPGAAQTVERQRKGRTA